MPRSGPQRSVLSTHHALLTRGRWEAAPALWQPVLAQICRFGENLRRGHHRVCVRPPTAAAVLRAGGCCGIVF